ncbi:response regulator [Aliikangiella coralliicola]|uniref:Response regulator n=1 Tax=Aliikangiella coralliicola TaxID=2592383 RepID=A0A545UI99_9GAMM|nr:response regulator [Aliikangiella coralliicola]TQV89196.1 response regulator [Aliikangiella coralliicola]
MSDTQLTNEVNQQFLRRTPVKLRQFSRLLSDMLTQKIDPLRIKALLSQVNKTREACIAHEFEMTANLLNQVFKQLSLSEDTLDTQKPLLKRLSAKLQEHSEKLELGVRPQKTPQQPAKDAVEVVEKPIEEEEVDEDDSVDRSLEEHGIYLDKGTIIFVSESGDCFKTMSEQFVSLGVDVHNTTAMGEARQHAIDNPGSVIVASLKFAENNEQLADEEIEVNRIPLIYTAEEDDQVNRLLALRNGGTGFLVEPVSVSGLLELIERQYDIHADSPYRVLVMEDSKAQARYYEKVLGKGHFDIRVVNNPEVLLEALRGFDPEALLMDMQMPGCSGIELTRIIRQMPRYAYLPIIFLSAEESITKQNQALLSGGTSFIVKPVQKEQLMFMANLYSRRYRDLNPQIGVNPDTGLTYSPQFKQQIAIESARMTRNSGNAALSIIQLDETEALIKNTNFSLINVAIQQLALLLKKRLRKTDIIGHLDNGQLGVILTTGNKSDWVSIMDEIRLQFAELPFHLQHQDKPLTVSIGLSALSTNSDAHKWFERSSTALKQAIEAGGDRIQPCDSLTNL